MFAVTLLRFIGADFTARKMRQNNCLATFQKSALICEQGAVSRKIAKYDSVSYGKKPITDDKRNSEYAFLESSVYSPS